MLFAAPSRLCPVSSAVSRNPSIVHSPPPFSESFDPPQMTQSEDSTVFKLIDQLESYLSSVSEDLIRSSAIIGVDQAYLGRTVKQITKKIPALTAPIQLFPILPILLLFSLFPKILKNLFLPLPILLKLWLCLKRKTSFFKYLKLNFFLMHFLPL
jgi:hypothetical protein